jgi:hypothetical protein
MKNLNAIILALFVMFFSLEISFAQEAVNDDFNEGEFLFTGFLNSVNRYQLGE